METIHALYTLFWEMLIKPFYPIILFAIFCLILREYIFKQREKRRRKKEYEFQKNAYKDALRELEEEKRE